MTEHVRGLRHEKTHPPRKLAGREACRASGTGAIRDFAQDRHRRTARMVGFALVADQPDAWAGLSRVLLARLTVCERASLAFAALRSLEPDAREQVFDASHWAGGA